MAESTLADTSVLVTRPRSQSAELADAIEACGGTAILFPVLDIVARRPADIRADLNAIPDADISIYISRNAVEHGIQYAAGRIAAIGPTTATAIEASGATVEICPADGFDTEHLLAETAFADVAGRNIRIIRGNHGREALADELRARGARVDYLATYERRLPDYTHAQLDSLESAWRSGGVGAIVVMSVASLENLNLLLPDWCRTQLPATPLVTPAARVLKEALKQHPGRPATLATGPQTHAIVAATIASLASSKHEPDTLGQT